MDTPTIVLAVLAGLLVVAALFGAWHAWRSRKPKSIDVEPGDAGESAPEQPESIRKRTLGPLSRFDARFERMMQRTQLGFGVNDACGLISLATVAGATLLFVLQGSIVGLFLGALAGFVTPLVVFRLMSDRYRNRLRNQLPDLFYLLARFLRGGLTLPQALHEAEVEGIEPVSMELASVNASVNLGLSATRALEKASRRIQLTDFDAFVSAVALSESTGGDLSTVLDRLAAGSRDRNQFHEYLTASTSRGRISAILISAAVPILIFVLYWMDPDRFTTFAQSSMGLTLLTVAVFLLVIGGIWIRRILRVDY